MAVWLLCGCVKPWLKPRAFSVDQATNNPSNDASSLVESWFFGMISMTRPRIDMNPVSFEIHGYIVPSNCYRLLRNNGLLELRCQVVEAEPFNGRGPTKPGICGDDLSTLCDR